VVKTDKGKPIAVMQLVVEERSVILDMLSVGREYQGQDIGTILVLLAENMACTIGKRILKLEALDTSIEFYTRRGFKKMQSEQDSEWGTVTYMEKQLIC
jgi:N-acetylglutamate synthase-like GNAT family acetyltransferase